MSLPSVHTVFSEYLYGMNWVHFIPGRFTVMVKSETGLVIVGEKRVTRLIVTVRIYLDERKLSGVSLQSSPSS